MPACKEFVIYWEKRLLRPKNSTRYTVRDTVRWLPRVMWLRRQRESIKLGSFDTNRERLETQDKSKNKNIQIAFGNGISCQPNAESENPVSAALPLWPFLLLCFVLLEFFAIWLPLSKQKDIRSFSTLWQKLVHTRKFCLPGICSSEPLWVTGVWDCSVSG